MVVVVVITSMMIKKRYSAIQSQKQTNHLSSHVSISPCSIGLLPGWTPSNGAGKLRPRLWQCMSLFALAKQEPWLTGHIFANGCLWILDDSRPPIPTKSHQRSYRIRIYGIVVLGSQRHGVLRVLQDMWVWQRMHLVVSHVP